MKNAPLRLHSAEVVPTGLYRIAAPLVNADELARLDSLFSSVSVWLTEGMSSTPPPEAPNLNAPAPATSSGLGLAGLIIGIVSLVLAFIPFINVLAGIAAVVGLILAIVAIAQKGKKKGAAAGGIVTSALALIMSFVMGFVYTNAFVEGVNEALEDSGVSVSSEAEEPADSPSEDAEMGQADQPASQDGLSRDNPLPLGSTVTLDVFGEQAWEVTVGPATLDATEEVIAENMFNDPPEDGLQYALLNITATYVGTESGVPWVDLTYSFVSSAGTTHETFDSFAVAPDPLSDINELYPGGSGSGNILIAIPSDDASGGTWKVGTLLGEEYFFAAQ